MTHAPHVPISVSAPPPPPRGLSRLLAAILVSLGCLATGACNPAPTSPGTGTGGAAGRIGGGTGGMPGSGGAGSGGAASGGRGTGGNTATGGATSGGSPGTGGGTGTGGAGTGGDGSGGRGSGGSASGGGAGSGLRDGGADALPDAAGGSSGSPAEALDKFRFECPCKPAAADHTSDGNCNVLPQTDRQTIVKMMGGDPGTVYDVTFRVRGLTEPNTYKNGMLQGQRFYIGGTTNTPGYTSYMMTVADPAQHFFFNYNATTGHVHFLLDYMVTVKIRGGSKVTFDVDGDGSVVDGQQVSNSDHLVVPDVPPAPNWYDGQFVQLDVISAEPSK